MASFSFGAGNARKLAAVPLYAAGRLATWLIPRVPGTWVFGCGAGIGDGALALWHEVAASGAPAVWVVGSDREARDAAARSIPYVRKGTLSAFWRTARAETVVVTHGFGDVDRYAVSGAFVVQLWHGIPLKRIGLDSPETLRVPGALRRLGLERPVRAALRFMFSRAARRIDLLPAASHVVRGRLESAFGLGFDQIPVTGEPRTDVLSRGAADERHADARTAIAGLTGAFDDATRLILYAPTWRDGAVDPAVPSSSDWEALLAVLEARDAVLVIRSHPLGAGSYVPPVETTRVRMLGSDLVPDVTPFLPGFDALVTDYSSLVFDTSLVPLPVVFLAPDLDAYAARRGFYGTYREIAGDDPAAQWPEVARRLDLLLSDPAEHHRRVERARALDHAVHAYRDGGATTRVHRAILTALADRSTPRGSR